MVIVTSTPWITSNIQKTQSLWNQLNNLLLQSCKIIMLLARTMDTTTLMGIHTLQKTFTQWQTLDHSIRSVHTDSRRPFTNRMTRLGILTDSENCGKPFHTTTTTILITTATTTIPLWRILNTIVLMWERIFHGLNFVAVEVAKNWIRRFLEQSRSREQYGLT
jgi:hypothetical protein